MPANMYEFTESWTIPNATPDAVWTILANVQLLPDWWKDVYLESQVLGEYVEPTVGGRARVKIRGFLPYTLDCIVEATALEPGKLVEARSTGDFDGLWRATLSPVGSGTRVDILWRVIVQKPIVRRLSPLLKSLFRWNHNWATAHGEAGLRAYLAQQGTSTAQAPGRGERRCCARFRA